MQNENNRIKEPPIPGRFIYFFTTKKKTKITKRTNCHSKARCKSSYLLILNWSKLIIENLFEFNFLERKWNIFILFEPQTSEPLLLISL